MLPFIPIEPRLDLEATTAYLAERNQWIESAKGAVHSDARSGFAGSRPSGRATSAPA
jgi:hypothetical protein